MTSEDLQFQLLCLKEKAKYSFGYYLSDPNSLIGRAFATDQRDMQLFADKFYELKQGWMKQKRLLQPW